VRGSGGPQPRPPTTQTRYLKGGPLLDLPALQQNRPRRDHDIVPVYLPFSVDVVVVDVNTEGGEYGNALYAASEGGFEKVVQMLLDENADANA
jgi:hypothetical protein